MSSNTSFLKKKIKNILLFLLYLKKKKIGKRGFLRGNQKFFLNSLEGAEAICQFISENILADEKAKKVTFLWEEDIYPNPIRIRRNIMCGGKAFLCCDMLLRRGIEARIWGFGIKEVLTHTVVLVDQDQKVIDPHFNCLYKKGKEEKILTRDDFIRLAKQKQAQKIRPYFLSIKPHKFIDQNGIIQKISPEEKYHKIVVERVKNSNYLLEDLILNTLDFSEDLLRLQKKFSPLPILFKEEFFLKYAGFKQKGF